MPSARARKQKHPVFTLTPAGFLVIIAGAVLLFLLDYYQYTLFSLVAATLVLVLAFGLFILAWEAGKEHQEAFYTVLGTGLLSAGILGLASALSLPGTGIVPAGADIAITLTIATWFLVGFTLLAAPFAAGKKVDRNQPAVVYGIILAAVLGSACAGILPGVPGGSGSLVDSIVRAIALLLIAVASAALYLNRDKGSRDTFPFLLAGDLLILGAGILVLLAGGASPIASVFGYLFWSVALLLFLVSCRFELVDRPAQLIHNELGECRQQFRIMNDYTYNWEYWTRPDRTFVYTTPSCTALTGYSPEEFYADPTLVQRMIHPRDQARISAHFTEESPSGNFASLEFRVVTKDKSVRWMHHSCHPVYDTEGKLRGRRATNRDITMQKNAEREILHLASFSMQAPVLIAEVNPDGKPLFLNPAMQKTIAELGLPGPEVFVPQDLLRQLKEGRPGADEPYQREVTVSERSFSESVLVTPEFGSLRIYVTDVTRQREAEKRIEDQSRFLGILLDTVPVPIFYRDLSGRYLGCNTAFENFVGVKRDRLLGRSVHEAPPGGLPGIDEEHDARLFLAGGPETSEARVRFADGSFHDVIRFQAPFSSADGKVGGVIGTFLDITERKRMEEALAAMNRELAERVKERTRELEASNISLTEEVARRSAAEKNLTESLRYTRAVFESNVDPMAVLTTKGIITDVNTAFEDMCGLPRQSLAGSSFSEFLKGSGDLDQTIGQILSAGRVEGIAGRMLHADGHTTAVTVNAAVFCNVQEDVCGIIVTAHDVTRQKEDEAVIRASLQEKTILLREIHHRVKNNLQIIISLLNLQSRKVTDPQMQESLRESIQRVRAMSLVHEKLYGGNDLAHIGLRSYIYSLVNSLVTFYNVSAGTVHLKLDVENIMVEVSTAIPLGLIINELISNSIKHAFPGGRKGEISVSARDVDGWLEVTVKDNGVGIAPGLDWKTADTLGLKLVNALSEQLEGTLRVVQDNGTAFHLRIPLM